MSQSYPKAPQEHGVRRKRKKDTKANMKQRRGRELDKGSMKGAKWGEKVHQARGKKMVITERGTSRPPKRTTKRSKQGEKVLTGKGKTKPIMGKNKRLV